MMSLPQKRKRNIRDFRPQKIHSWREEEEEEEEEQGEQVRKRSKGAMDKLSSCQTGEQDRRIHPFFILKIINHSIEIIGCDF